LRDRELAGISEILTNRAENMAPQSSFLELE
jgi:hypothetical protein